MDFLTNEEIGKIIKIQRLNLNLTQQELGEKLGVTPSAVNKWELGVVMNIKREVLRNLSTVLHINPAILIGIKPEEMVISEVEFTHSEIVEIQNYITFVKSKRG